MTRLFRHVAIACALALPLFSNAVGAAQSVSPAIAAPETSPSQSTNPDASTVPPAAPIAEPQSQFFPETDTTTVSCAANEFASKFPDVTPADWAYEAVNRVAVGELRCFSNSSSR